VFGYVSQRYPSKNVPIFTPPRKASKIRVRRDGLKSRVVFCPFHCSELLQEQNMASLHKAGVNLRHEAITTEDVPRYTTLEKGKWKEATGLGGVGEIEGIASVSSTAETHPQPKRRVRGEGKQRENSTAHALRRRAAKEKAGNSAIKKTGIWKKSELSVSLLSLSYQRRFRVADQPPVAGQPRWDVVRLVPSPFTKRISRNGRENQERRPRQWFGVRILLFFSLISH